MEQKVDVKNLAKKIIEKKRSVIMEDVDFQILPKD